MKTVGNCLHYCQIFLVFFISETLFAENATNTLSLKCGSDVITPLSTVKNDSFTDSAVAALTGKMTDKSELDRTLRKLINHKADTVAQQYLQDRARLLLAARALRDDRTESARQLLRVIARGSPVAVDAALLLAHSYRVEGNDKDALQWFLRVVHQYPEYPSALRGLLRAGDDLMNDGHTSMANRLFHEAGQNALAMLQQLDALPDDAMARSDLIFTQTSPLDASNYTDKKNYAERENQDPVLSAAVRRQLIESMLKQAEHTINVQRVEQQYRQQWQCLLQQRARFDKQRQRVAADTIRLHTALQESEQTQRMLTKKIDSLSKEIIPGDLSEQQRRVRQQLTTARNHQQVLKAQHAFLQQSSEALPVMLARTESQLTMLTDLYSALRQRADIFLQKDIDQAVMRLRNDFSNIAAEAHWRQAELQHSTD